MENSESPSGRFLITISAWEARMSLWIETPMLSDRTSGEHLLVFKDSNWSLNSAEWLSESVVVLKLRKYPGSHNPAEVAATIDCSARTAEIDGKRVSTLALVERCLDEALAWRKATPPNIQGGGGLRRLIRRFFRGSH
jgi:hypothetical protein